MKQTSLFYLLVFSPSLKMINYSQAITQYHIPEQKNIPYQLADNLIPIPPKIKTIIDWQSYFIPIIQQILSTNIISNDSSLFISTIKNNTKYTFEIDQITNILINVSTEHNKKKFTLINQKIPYKKHINMKYQNNNLLSCIKLAKCFNAEYILYSNINSICNETNTLSLEMQLISIHSKEIMWSHLTNIILTQNQVNNLSIQPLN